MISEKFKIIFLAVIGVIVLLEVVIGFGIGMDKVSDSYKLVLFLASPLVILLLMFASSLCHENEEGELVNDK